MLRVLTLLLATLILWSSAMAQQKAERDEEMDRASMARTVDRLLDAWNKHDAHAFAMIFTEDADFTNVRGVHAHGRANVEAFHAPIFATVFKGSHLTAKIRSIRFLTPDLAAVDVDSVMTGAKFQDGSPRPDRKTLVNCVMALQADGSWLIEILHNTELNWRTLPHPRNRSSRTTGRTRDSGLTRP
jgi:uncharacterized protein (TIGR02246 family)